MTQPRVRTIRRMHGILLMATAILAAALWQGAAMAAEEAGTVAAVEGTGEIGRGGVWQPAVAGLAVQVGDELKTGPAGRLRVVFRDDTVLNLGEDTRLTIDHQFFSPDEGLFRSSMKLIQGKVRALVGEYYGRAGAEYEVKTETAVAGVRGTEFVVSYDPAREVTKVVGIEGRVEVRSSREKIAQSVFVTSGELTQVDPGRPPDSPRFLDEPQRRRYLEGLDFVSVGSRSLAAADPLLARQVVPAPDRAPGAAGRSGKEHEPPRRPDVGDLLGQPPTVVEKTTGGARISF